MSTYHNDDLDAILDWLRRLETRLCKLMLHYGHRPDRRADQDHPAPGPRTQPDQRPEPQRPQEDAGQS